MPNAISKRWNEFVSRFPEPAQTELREASVKDPAICHRLMYPKYLTVIPTEMDYARLAAYIDGEGSICIGRTKPNPKFRARIFVHQLTVQVANGDPRLMDWLMERWGGGVNYCMRGDIMHFNWVCHYKDRENILVRCRPYFVIKREQCDIGLAFLKIPTSKKGRSRSTPPEILDARDSLHAKMIESHSVRMTLKKFQAPYASGAVVGEVGYMQ